MPVRKFENPDEARRALWTSRDDPRLLDRIRRLWERSRRLAPGGGRRGVQRFRSVEEAQADRRAWVAERVRALREKRKTARRPPGGVE